MVPMIGPFDAADAADHRDEDDEGGPVVDAEGGVGRDAQLLQEDQRADHGGAEGGQHIDDELDTRDVDAVALRRQFVVADGGEREAVARAQQRDDRAQDGDGERQREPIDHEFAHLPARRHRDHDRGRQADAGAAAERRDLRGEQAEHLRHHPGADGEVVPAQAEDQRRHRDRDQRADRPASGMAASGCMPSRMTSANSR